jgi:hypothetical protein
MKLEAATMNTAALRGAQTREWLAAANVGLGSRGAALFHLVFPDQHGNVEVLPFRNHPRRFQLCGKAYLFAVGGPVGGRSSAMQLAEIGTGGQLFLASGFGRRNSDAACLGGP